MIKKTVQARSFSPNVETKILIRPLGEEEEFGDDVERVKLLTTSHGSRRDQLPEMEMWWYKQSRRTLSTQGENRGRFGAASSWRENRRGEAARPSTK